MPSNNISLSFLEFKLKYYILEHFISQTSKLFTFFNSLRNLNSCFFLSLRSCFLFSSVYQTHTPLHFKIICLVLFLESGCFPSSFSLFFPYSTVSLLEKYLYFCHVAVRYFSISCIVVILYIYIFIRNDSSFMLVYCLTVYWQGNAFVWNLLNNKWKYVLLLMSRTGLTINAYACRK